MSQEEDEFKPKKKDFFFYSLILAGLSLIAGYIMSHYSNYEREGNLAMVGSMLVISTVNLYNYFDSGRKDIIAGVLGMGTLLLGLNIIFNG